MTEIVPFRFPETGQPVRTLLIDGEPWFVGMDVTSLLGYVNGRDALAGLPDRMRNTVAIPDGNRGNPNRAIISESGVYRLVMRSNLAAAESFQDWLAEDVIPSIRRTGSYSALASPRLPDLASPAGVLALAEQFHKTAQALVLADEKIRDLEPKALGYDTFLSADKGDRLVREVAKLLGWKERDLRTFLLDEKLIFPRQTTCGVNQYDVYAAHLQHFKPVETVVEHRWGSCAHYTLYVRTAGVDLIRRRIERQRVSIQTSIEASL
jgi:anti-repressor protein